MESLKAIYLIIGAIIVFILSVGYLFTKGLNKIHSDIKEGSFVKVQGNDRKIYYVVKINEERLFLREYNKTKEPDFDINNTDFSISINKEYVKLFT